MQVNEISSNGGNSFSSSTTLPSLNCDQVHNNYTILRHENSLAMIITHR